MKKKLIFIIGFAYFLLVIPSIAFESCDEALKDCTSEADKWDSLCIEVKKAGIDFNCESDGYKPGSMDYLKCKEDYTKNILKNCRELYRKNTDACYSAYKNCRKGDIFGIIHLSFKEKGDVCSSAYIERNGSSTIVGIWKYQPSESYGYVQSFRPDNPQIIYNYYETAVEHSENCPPLTPHSHDCPLLEWRLQDGSAKILVLDPRFDGPGSRFQIYNIPNIGKIYTVSNPGMPVEIKGEKREGRSRPECLRYKNYSRRISVGGFGIFDNVLPNGEMRGSGSWKSCGHPFQHEIGFGIGKDSSKLFKGKYSPPKYSPPEGSCPSGSLQEDVFIQVNWRFYLIK